MDLASLVAAFESATVAGRDFTHAAHLRVAVALLHQARRELGPGPAAMESARARMETGLRRLLVRLGKPETAYHETVTRAWLLLLDDLLAGDAGGGTAAQLADEAVTRFARGGPLKAHYSDERLASPLARQRWLVPDREPLPGQRWHVRLATADDLGSVNAIYNHYVPVSTCTFDLEPLPADVRRCWFDEHDATHPVTVAVSTDGGAVVGWGSLSRFRARPAYGRTVESSVYLDAGHQGQGLGRLLLDDLLERARVLGHHTVIAGVTGGQEASLALHRAAGFEEVGRFREVGWKFDRWLDVIFLQRPVG